MTSRYRTAKAARLAAGACLAMSTAVATAGVTAVPSWALPRGSHHRVPPTTTPAPVATLATTTTILPSTPPLVPPAPAPADNCARGNWPGAVQGRPVALQAQDGAYLWHDPDGGWALRVTRSGARDKTVYSGSLTSATGRFLSIQAAMGNPNDIVASGVGKHAIYFRFVGNAMVDGLDFATQCAKSFRVDIHAGSSVVPADDVHLGGALTSPASVPFRVDRSATASTEVTG